MRITLPVSLVFLALVLPASSMGAESGAVMWGCAAVGERRNILYLSEQGSHSYIKFSGQRISATVTSNESEKRWTWGPNAMVLDAEDFVRYYEGDTLKAQFKCKTMQ